jgi:hypothetical protein
LERCGYGSNFNRLYIDKNERIIKKICYSALGKKKIESEIEFYHYIEKYEDINKYFPKIKNYLESGYVMEYLDGYEPLYKVYQSNQKIDIFHILKNLHSVIKPVDKETFISDLQIEIETKILERHSNSRHIIEDYDYIKRVNGLQVYSIPEITLKIKSKIMELIKDREQYNYVIIHGDCQFNNIVYNKSKNNIKLIDPRGYFGNSLIYGMEEYDLAKVLFALSGYDEFDNRNISNIEIENDNISVKLEPFDLTIYDNLTLELLLMISIWCGNFSCFVNDKSKMLYSYNIARYLGTMVINKFNL